MLPFLHFGPLRIPTYGLMMGTAFIVALILIEREFRRRGMGRNVGWDTVAIGLIAGVIGARINYLIEHPDELARAPMRAMFGGSGMTWFGGFILGLAAVLVFWRIRKVRLLPGLDTVATVLPLAYAIGRLGCQLAGDGDYGKVSTLPWAMAYPRGLVPAFEPVHPTPVYEIILMTGFFLILWNLRFRKLPNGLIFALYLVGYGVERFLIEFLRTNKPVVWWLTEAQVVSLLLFIAGVILLAKVAKPRVANREQVAGSR
jgi:phosphatidylglycerol:prolipoprotein diacylglycerol transferase